MSIPGQRALTLIPVGVPVAGRRRDFIFGLADRLYGKSLDAGVIDSAVGPLEIDTTAEPERMIALLFPQMLRYYSRSPLGTWIRRRAIPGRTFVDAGANLGMYSMVAKLRGLSAVTIEPEPAHARFLARNAATIGPTVSVALSNEAGALPLYYEKGNPGATSLFPLPSYDKSEFTVPVQTFSQIVADGLVGNPASIQLLKIDVEGFEAQVVEGMRDFLADGHRPDIWCEVRGDTSSRNGGSFRPVIEVLTANGYDVALPQGRDLVSASEATMSSMGVFDLLFTASS